MDQGRPTKGADESMVAEAPLAGFGDRLVGPRPHPGLDFPWIIVDLLHVFFVSHSALLKVPYLPEGTTNVLCPCSSC